MFELPIDRGQTLLSYLCTGFDGNRGEDKNMAGEPLKVQVGFSCQANSKEHVFVLAYEKEQHYSYILTSRSPAFEIMLKYAELKMHHSLIHCEGP